MFLVLILQTILAIFVGIPGWILSIVGECLKAAGDIMQRECSQAMKDIEKGANEAEKTDSQGKRQTAQEDSSTA